MTFLAGLQLAVKIAPWAAGCAFAGLYFLKKRKAERERIRADEAELKLTATQADIVRKNAALAALADNMKRMKDEKARISKLDLDGLIAHAVELSDVPGDSGPGEGGNTDTGKDVISGRIIDG